MPTPSEALEWKPLLFVRYREGKKQRTADLRGPEWREPLGPALSSVLVPPKRLWSERAIDLGLRNGAPEWIRIVTEYEGETGTAFIPWSDVVAFEYKGELLPEDAAPLPFPR